MNALGALHKICERFPAPAPRPVPQPAYNPVPRPYIPFHPDELLPRPPAPAPAPAPRARQPRQAGRAEAKNITRLNLPDGITLYCRHEGVIYQALWHQNTHTIRSANEIHGSPSGWATSLGKHCNGWDHCYTIPNPILPTQTKSLTAYWNEQHRVGDVGDGGR